MLCNLYYVVCFEVLPPNLRIGNASLLRIGGVKVTVYIPGVSHLSMRPSWSLHYGQPSS